MRELLSLASDDERDAFEDLLLSYHPTRGDHELREEIARTYRNLSAEDILCFAGAQEAIFWTFIELLGPDDHAIITVPNYQSMEEIPRSTGASLSGLSLGTEPPWGLDLDEVVSLLKPNTKVIAVNFPNNPTGFIPRPEVFSELTQLCAERDIHLFSDEVFRGLELDGARRLPQAAETSETAISLNVMSKSYGLPGLRIGWIATRDRVLLDRLERRKHYTSICNAGPSEALATIALKHGRSIQERNRSIIKANTARFDEFFSRWADVFDWYLPDGGCVSFPRYLEVDVEAFCRGLVDEVGVILLPAGVFASALADVPTDRFRIGIGRKDPQPALAAFDDYLKRRHP